MFTLDEYIAGSIGTLSLTSVAAAQTLYSSLFPFISTVKKINERRQ